MAEVNNISEKADKIMDAVESKMATENSVKGEKSAVNNSLGELAASSDTKGDTPNGKQESQEPNVEDKVEKAINGENSQREEEKTEAATKPKETEKTIEPEKVVVPTSEAPPPPATTEKDEADGEEKTEDVQPEEKEKEKGGKPGRGRGRGAPRGRGRGGAAGRGRGKAKPASDGGASSEEPEPEPETKPAEADAEKKKGEPAMKPTEEPEKKAEPEKKKPGRKRGASKQSEATAPKSPKQDEGGPSGVQGVAAEKKKIPLLEEPATVEGKRQRHKVERLDSSMLATQSRNKDVDLPQGSGTKLGEIPYIDALISKAQVDDLKPLHRLCFGRQGTVHDTRKNLRTFCGFDIQKDTDAYTKKLKAMDHWTLPQMKKICEVLGLERSHKKEMLQSAVLDFLIKPSDSGRQAPQPKSRKGATSGRKRSASSHDKKKGGGKKGAVSESEASAGEAEGSDSKEEEDEEDKEEEDEPEPPKAKRGKKPAAKKETSAAATTAASTSKKAPRGKAAATKKAKKNEPPTDEDLRETIQELLEGANLQETTMREMCGKVFAKYPEYNLNARKDFIKATVKSIISDRETGAPSSERE